MTQLSATLTSNSVRRAVGLFITAACLTAGVCLVTGTKALAQDAPQGPDPLDENKEQYSDPFSGRDQNQYTPFFNMMHRMQLGTIRSVSEFDQDQQQNIGTAASDFRTRQQERLQQQGQASPAITPTQTTPAPTSNRPGSNP